MGNIHPKVTEALLAEVFTAIGPLAGCKLIRKEKVWLVWKSLYLKLQIFCLSSKYACQSQNGMMRIFVVFYVVFLNLHELLR